MQALDVAIAVILQRGRILVCQRRADAPLGGFWEFPGGKREPGESLEQCVVREVREELGIAVRPVQMLTPIEHHYDHAHVRLNAFICTHESGEVQHIGCQTSQWINPPTLRQIRFPPANEQLIEEVLSYLHRGLESAPDPVAAP